MSPLEIDKALALAIGYSPEHVKVVDGVVIVNRPCSLFRTQFWSSFDHTDAKTIWPLAKHYGMTVYFPEKSARIGLSGAHADTPEAAVAMAIIRGVK